MKKVSVVIPAYNAADLTVKTVESVLEQTYANIEVIVVDDGSTDNTGERLQPYAGRIKYIYKENGGACSARNLGIRMAEGDYIGFLDCDDIYLPGKIERSVDYLERRPDFGFVHTPVRFIDEEDVPLRVYALPEGRRTGRIAKRLLSRNFICNSTILARRSCFGEAGFFDEKLFTHADWDMWLRLAERYKVGYINSPLTLYRRSTNYILRHLEQSKREGLAVLEKAFRRDPGLKPYLKNRLVSNVCFRNAVGYLRINDPVRAKEELILSIRKNMFNPGALLLLAAAAVLHDKLGAALKRVKLL